VHHRELVADPIGTVASVYRHFGLTLGTTATAAIGRYAGQRPNGGYGPRAYRFEDHGLDAGAEREKFRGYMERFGVQVEGGEGRPHRR
jgi:hypothetical protein